MSALSGTALLAGTVLAGGLAGGLGPNPVPDGPRELDPDTVTPGVVGFLATAAVVLVSILLIVNLVHRMRRIRHRAALQEAADQAREQQLRGRSLDASEQDDDERRGAGLPAGHDVVQGEVHEVLRGEAPAEPREDRRGRAADRDEPGTSDQPRT